MKAQERWLGGYLRRMADALELRDWTVRLMPGDPDDARHIACAQVVYGTRELKLWFRYDFYHETPEAQRKTVVHELLHAHLNKILEAVENGHAALGDTAYGILLAGVMDRLEEAGYAITEILAPGLPQPPTQPGRKP